MKTKVNEIPLVGPKGRSELIKKINGINENIDSKFKVLEEVLGMDLNPNLDEKYCQYFTIEATQDGTKVYFRQSSYAVDESIAPLKVEVSTDNGETWEEITAAPAEDDVPGATLAELDEGDKVLIRGKNDAYGYYSDDNGEPMDNCNFWADSPCYVYGNIMSLIGGNDFARLRKVKEYAFAYFFTEYEDVLDHSWVLPKEGEELLLPATTLAVGCYSEMFSGCTNLSYIKAMFTTTPGNSYTYNWVNNVKGTGTFVKNSAATWNVTGNNGVPTGWTVETANS